MKKFIVIFRDSINDVTWNKILFYHRWEGLYKLGFRLINVLPVRDSDYFISYHISDEYIHRFIFELSEAVEHGLRFQQYDVYDHEKILNDIEEYLVSAQEVIDGMGQ